MPEIGETLRETRMRRRIDMTEVEAATKIRAKYLRALENEEWDLLPGPTFVKTFLRTYAEYLELDPRLLVEEYRQRYERPSTQDLTPFGPGMGGQRGGGASGRGADRAVPRRAVRHRGCCSARCTCSARLGRRPARRSAEPRRHGHADGDRDRHAAQEESRARRRRRRRRGSTLKLTATDRVFVCLVDATGKQVVDGESSRPASARDLPLQALPGELRQWRVRMTVDGKRYRVENIGRADRLRVPAGQEAPPPVRDPFA